MFIKSITKEDADKILAEAEETEYLFKNHYLGNPELRDSALKDGKSIWLHGDLPNKHWADIHYGNIPDNRFFIEDKAPFLCNYIKEAGKFLGSENFGRAYIYSLGPGKKIARHIDIKEYYRKINRYHLYFDIPDGVKIEHSGATIFPYTMIQFNPRLPHSYENNSSSNFVFVVFDIFKNE